MSDRAGENWPCASPAIPSGTGERTVYEHSVDGGAIPREVSVDYISIDQAGSMKAYTRAEGSVTWRAVDFAVSGGLPVFPLAVAASSPGVDNCIRVDVSSYPRVRFTFTPSVALSAWEVAIVQHW